MSQGPDVNGVDWLRSDQLPRLLVQLLAGFNIFSIVVVVVSLGVTGLVAWGSALWPLICGGLLAALAACDFVFVEQVRPSAIGTGGSFVHVRRLSGRRAVRPLRAVEVGPARRYPGWGYLRLEKSSNALTLTPAQFDAIKRALENLKD